LSGRKNTSPDKLYFLSGHVFLPPDKLNFCRDMYS